MPKRSVHDTRSIIQIMKNRVLMKTIFVVIFASMTASAAAAEMYRCDDENGHVTFSDKSCGETAEKIRVELPRQSASSPPTVEAEAIRMRLVHLDRPITELTSATPSLWLRDESNKSGGAVKFSMRHNVKDQTFSISGIPDGRYGVGVTIDANAENPTNYPGDYYAWKTFTTTNKPGAVMLVHMERVIRMLQPQDNNFPLPLWGNACRKKIAFSGPLKFAWESLGPDVRYSYDVRRTVCEPFAMKESVVSDNTGATHVTLELPVSAPGEMYVLTLRAQGLAGQPVGTLMTHGHQGHGWDYRFRVTP